MRWRRGEFLSGRELFGVRDPIVLVELISLELSVLSWWVFEGRVCGMLGDLILMRLLV